jgi:hypothetical protein
MSLHQAAVTFDTDRIVFALKWKPQKYEGRISRGNPRSQRFLSTAKTIYAAFVTVFLETPDSAKPCFRSSVGADVLILSQADIRYYGTDSPTKHRLWLR